MPLSYLFLIRVYLKYLIIITFGLGIFFVCIDTLKYSNDLPDSANLIVLFVLYDFMYACGFIFPISLLLAEVVLLSALLKNNEFTAFLSLGYSKKRIAIPIFCTAFICILGFIALNATPFAYAKENVDLIIDQNASSRNKGELLVKHQNNYIYFDKIFPLLQKANDIRVYTLQGKNLTQLIQAKEAFFENNRWNLKNVTIFTLNPDIDAKEKIMQIQQDETMGILEGFRPKILDIIYEKSGSVSIIDAISSLILLNNEQIQSPKIRGILYSLTIFPLFVFPVLVLVFTKMPLTTRYGELTFYIFRSILIALVSWGIFFALSRFAQSGFIHPEWSLLLPMCLWWLVGIYFTTKIN
ncbi:permease [Helicobacter monodelphidis]|uniref:LptF/LptG family permease n=1 Tax=Helicobacter sp. 15-1451 TaxID=2004995 RepID=UPI000DCC3794|nr:LptF/LptG family permease [Helicobacter sp. 15-1451]RAX57599.1 permease [Helicobacter sp. 15-1451]